MECNSTNITVQYQIMIKNQLYCFVVTNTITVAVSGTTINIQSGGEATFIAGNKIIFNEGFTAHLGSYANAYITTTGDYCSQQQNMAPAANEIIGEDESTTFKDLEISSSDDNNLNINIYPTPTRGEFVIDFSGKQVTAEISMHNYFGAIVYNETIHEQTTKKINISDMPMGMYIVAINCEGERIVRKIVKAN